MGYGKSRRIWPARAVVLSLGLGLLTGCATGVDVPFLKAGDKPAEAASVASTSTRLVERDVEAPEVFQVTEAGLWDGRPSLGGVWVAHPDVKEPERVIIRNTANGKFVIGALFRREREIPGPRIQASSDAAAALGMLAGAPVKLNVTALRREKVEETPPAPAPAATIASAERTDAEAAGKDAKKPDAGKTQPDGRKKQDKSGDIAAAPIDPIAGAAAAAIAATAPKKRPEAGAASPSAGAKRTGPAPAKTAAETAPPKKPAKKPAAPARKASSLEKPFIQIGIFNIEANAMRTAGLMRSVGIIPTVYEQNSKGKPFWRVVVGPARTRSERSALMKQVRKAGFSDAYYVTN